MMMRRLLFVIPVILLIGLVIYFAIGLKKDPNKLPSVLVGNPVPAFALPRLDDASRTLTQEAFSGPVTLVNFFASWCVSCRAEHRFLEQITERGVPIYGLVWKDTPAKAQRFLDQFGDPYTAVAVDEEGFTGIDFGVYGLPETYIIDAEGIIRYRHPGPILAKDLQEVILPLISKYSTAATAGAAREEAVQ